MLLSITCIGISAAENASSSFSVNSGDTVVYTLYVENVPQDVVCSDYSIYFDKDKLNPTKYSNTPSGSVVNKDLPGEVRGNFVTLDGVQCKKPASIITVEFKATGSGDTNINYYMRDMYYMDKNNDMVVVDTYDFICSVEVNSNKVIDNKPAELNVEQEQERGQFVNSISGKSDDKGINVYEGISNVEGVEFSNKANGGEQSEKNATLKKNEGTSKTFNNQTGNDGNKSTSNNSTNNNATSNNANSKGPSIYLIIILCAILIAIVVAVVVYFVKKRKNVDD